MKIYDLLRGIKTSDGFVFAAPVYYFDVPSQMRAILERLFYPGESEREIPVAAIYTMNQNNSISTIPSIGKILKNINSQWSSIRTKWRAVKSTIQQIGSPVMMQVFDLLKK